MTAEKVARLAQISRNSSTKKRRREKIKLGLRLRIGRTNGGRKIWWQEDFEDRKRGALQNSSLPHKCGVPNLAGTPHLCGSGAPQKNLGEKNGLTRHRLHLASSP